MVIEYKNKDLEQVCTSPKIARKKYGDNMAKKIHLRISQIQSFEDVETLVNSHVGRCHLLTQDRKNQYAMDLEHPYRLIFVRKENSVEVVKVIEITDYH